MKIHGEEKRMANIKPFQAIRPKEELASRIAALPYDVYSREEARKIVEKDKYSFLRIDRAETQFPEDYDMYSDEVYQKAHDMLWDMVAHNDFVQDEKKCYYIYELEMNGRKQTGIVACASVDDYLNQVIKKHENTREEKELDRIRHVETCSAQTGPIFLAYRNQKEISEIVKTNQKNKPVYDFTSEDGIIHRVWVISNEQDIHNIEQAFSKVKNIYIADGHHRCASAVKVGLKKRQIHPDYTGEEEFNYFLSVLFPDDQLMIMDYNRVVKDLNGLTADEFKTKVSEHYEIECTGEKCFKPEKRGQIAMFLEDKWYQLVEKDEGSDLDPVSKMDVSKLQKYVLNGILGIEDPKTDKRIDFVGGIRGIEELERRVHNDCKVAFAMYPTSIQELFAVADADMLMPPKSTWFEPKLRSGLFIHAFEE